MSGVTLPELDASSRHREVASDFAEAIADGVVSDEELVKHAKHIEHESIRLSEMVDDLFEMSKINAGAVSPAYDKVALDEVVDAVLEGRIHNGTLMVGLLAVRELRARGWAGLRPADVRFDIHPRVGD